LASKLQKKRERLDTVMDMDMEHEFASPKRRKLREVEDDDRMIDIRGPGVQRAADVEIPVIEASSVTTSRILQFGHSEEDKAELAALSMKKAKRDKIELAHDVAERELHKQEEAEQKEANKMQE
jgi:hypothetical protein